MTVTELIVMLAQLPPELEVVIDTTGPEEPVFRLEVVEAAEQIKTSSGDLLVLLNPPARTEVMEDDDDI
jgi:hypothetical protein